MRLCLPLALRSARVTIEHHLPESLWKCVPGKADLDVEPPKGLLPETAIEIVLDNVITLRGRRPKAMQRRAILTCL